MYCMYVRLRVKKYSVKYSTLKKFQQTPLANTKKPSI